MTLRKLWCTLLGWGLFCCGLTQAQVPQHVVMSMQNNPQTSMGFSWFTARGTSAGEVQVGTTSSQYSESAPATMEDITLLYKGLTKEKYTVHKAVVEGLEPGTTYYFRVGSEQDGWSEEGSFTTAEENPESFSFIYVTDPQASNEDQFAISARTTHAAHKLFPQAHFWVNAGDLVNKPIEWQYEQFFTTQQDIFLQKPTAFVIGNHDVGNNRNFTHHFNYPPTSFDDKMKVPGSVYSFVWGNALFLAMQFEDYHALGYLDSVTVWIRNQVAQHPEVKWIIPIVHKPLYTGAGHANDLDVKTVRKVMEPLFNELGIDFCIQGHDHIYQVIGPLDNGEVVEEAITQRKETSESRSGYKGGVYDVTKGTLYFSNNTAGHKKYNPLTGVNPKWFTGLFMQPNQEIFSHVQVSRTAIRVQSYAVDEKGTPSLFDEFTLVKPVHVQGVVLNETSLSLEVGQTKQLLPNIEPADADNQRVTWSNSDEAVATVDGAGNVKAMQPGETIITVTTVDGGKTSECRVTVTANSESTSGTTPNTGTPDPDSTIPTHETTPTPVVSTTLTQVQIVPNPFAHYVVLKGVEQVVEYTWYNVQGRVIQKGFLHGESEVQIDTHHWLAGVYIVALRAHDGVATFRRVVKH